MTPDEIFHKYLNPSDTELIAATNALLQGWGRYVGAMSNARMRPVSITEWTSAIIRTWEETPDERA